jgi:indolepyruvate ferredoxin oxidoreductase
MQKVDILNGNELIVEGALEAGFSLYTGYPGSPLADYFNILHHKRKELKEKGIHVVIANSEANGAAMASGAKQAGRDCLVGMKSMGLHVASDALSVGNFALPHGADEQGLFPGTVIAVGDDPWSMSTSTPADSRYLFKHLHIPFLEPSTPQELKDWMKVALDISKQTSVYQGLLLTTFMAEGGGRVTLGEHKEVKKTKDTIDPKDFDLSKNVMVPPNSLMADGRMINERFPKIFKVMEELNLDQVSGKKDASVGVISSGAICETLKQLMEEQGYIDHFSLYKLASPYPLIENLLLPWLKGLEHLIVVEEKRGFIETELSELISKHNLNLKVYGKDFVIDGEKLAGFPAHGGLSFEILNEKFALLSSKLKLHQCEREDFSMAGIGQVLPVRLPTFCPGCPHRETLSLLKDLRKKLASEGMDLISHGDVGCYSLSFLPPFKEMHNLSAMGQGGALGAGMDMFTTNPSVVLMGDSTFYHSGLTDISNSVQAGHTITYILLDNDNTAMTGHQMTPSSGISVDGETKPVQNMLKVVEGLGVKNFVEVNPSDRYFYQNLLIDYVKKPGVKVIVSNKECGLTFHGRRKSAERKVFGSGKTKEVQQFYQINTAACEDCRVCVESTGCPGLTQIEDAYGTKVAIDPQICVSDSYCTKLKACPSFELVEVLDYHPSKYKKSSASQSDVDVSDLPEPAVGKSLSDIAASGVTWRGVVTGVGGSGVTTISRVLAEAAREMDGRDDLDFKFMDQKGLAQRNGNVTGHLAIFKKGNSYGAVTPMGTADVLLSPDLLDGTKQLPFLGKSGQAILDKKFQMPLSIILDNGEGAAPLSEESLNQTLIDKMGDQVFRASMKDICDQVFGRSVYASAMVLGVAYQAGRLPFSLSNMRSAFEKTMKKTELENNWQAFSIGRKVYVHGEEGLLGSNDESELELSLLKKSIKQTLLPWIKSDVILSFFDRDLKRLTGYLPEISKTHLAQYLHDLYVYDRGVKTDQFITDAASLKTSVHPENLSMAVRTLAKTYFVKDEVFVSHLMISPIQAYRDQVRYGSLGSSFRKIHINRPEFDIGEKKIAFDINPKDWMLKIMRHARLLRLVLPSWHKKERELASTIRSRLLKLNKDVSVSEQYQSIKKMENVKGYRDVRYEKAEAKL